MIRIDTSKPGTIARNEFYRSMRPGNECQEPARHGTGPVHREIQEKHTGLHEDSGGPPVYEHILEVLSEPKHKEYDELSEWAGEDFDPEAFDLDTVNVSLGKL